MSQYHKLGVQINILSLKMRQWQSANRKGCENSENGNASSSGSAGSLIRSVQKLLDSDEDQKNSRKISSLKSEFPILKRIHPSLSNGQKLQIFLRDPSFRHKIIEKMTEKGFNCGPIFIKAFLVNKAEGAPVSESFDEQDIINIFQRFGQILQVHISQNMSYIGILFPYQAYIATKALNGLEVNRHLRLCVKLCNEEETAEMVSLFAGGSTCMIPGPQRNMRPKIKNPLGQSTHKNPMKHIAKFELGVDNLSEFNLPQRLIGPRGSSMKKVMEKILSRQTGSNKPKYTLSNIDSVLKIRLNEKKSSATDSEDKVLIYISSKQRHLYDLACEQIENWVVKVLGEYKVSFQVNCHRYCEGVAYRILEQENGLEKETKRVAIEQIDNPVDVLSLSQHPRLPPKVIDDKIWHRERARKQGKFEQADKIRNWLRANGVSIVDPKNKGKKTTWSYMM